MSRKSHNRVPLSVRAGTRRDIPLILKMIRGLAEYEHLEHEMKATAARLRRDAGARRPYFETLVCQRGRKVIGFALYFYTYSTFAGRPSLYIEDLFVRTEERGKGAGKALLGALARIALKRGCGRMEWLVLRENTPAIRFYERIGAKLHEEWILTRLSEKRLKQLSGRLFENGERQNMKETSEKSGPLYLEDLHVGRRFVSVDFRMDAAGIKAFAAEYDPQPFHLDEAAAENSFFQGLAASGWHTAAVTMRLLVASVPLAGGLVGLGGVIEWPKPTRPGDVLHVESEIMEIKPSRTKPDRGVATVRIITLNQNGERAQEFTAKILVFRRSSGAAASAKSK